MSFLVGIKNSKEATRTTTTRSWRLKTKEMKKAQAAISIVHNPRDTFAHYHEK